MKDLSIGGIVMLNRTDKGDKAEEIVEPMEVSIRFAFCQFFNLLTGEQGIVGQRGRRG